MLALRALATPLAWSATAVLLHLLVPPTLPAPGGISAPITQLGSIEVPGAKEEDQADRRAAIVQLRGRFQHGQPSATAREPHEAGERDQRGELRRWWHARRRLYAANSQCPGDAVWSAESATETSPAPG